MTTYTALTSSIISIGLLCLAACNQKSSEVVITETREVTNRDTLPQLFASSEDQFLSPQAKQAFTGTSTAAQPVPSGSTAKGEPHLSGIHADYTGSDWTEVASTQFRVLNYTFPTGEIYVSISGGGLMPNINRWLRQFQAEAITDLSALSKAPLGSNLQAYIVEASGSYSPGMGRPNKENQALLSAIAEYPAAGPNQFISVKLIADAPLNDTLKQDFFTFIEKLHWNE